MIGQQMKEEASTCHNGIVQHRFVRGRYHSHGFLTFERPIKRATLGLPWPNLYDVIGR